MRPANRAWNSNARLQTICNFATCSTTAPGSNQVRPVKCPCCRPQSFSPPAIGACSDLRALGSRRVRGRPGVNSSAGCASTTVTAYLRAKTPRHVIYFSRTVFVQKFTLDHTLLNSHFASHTELAT